jgi:hypothetical protein
MREWLGGCCGCLCSPFHLPLKTTDHAEQSPDNSLVHAHIDHSPDSPLSCAWSVEGRALLLVPCALEGILSSGRAAERKGSKGEEKREGRCVGRSGGWASYAGSARRQRGQWAERQALNCSDCRRRNWEEAQTGHSGAHAD